MDCVPYGYRQYTLYISSGYLLLPGDFWHKIWNFLRIKTPYTYWAPSILLRSRHHGFDLVYNQKLYKCIWYNEPSPHIVWYLYTKCWKVMPCRISQFHPYGISRSWRIKYRHLSHVIAEWNYFDSYFLYSYLSNKRTCPLILS